MNIELALKNPLWLINDSALNLASQFYTIFNFWKLVKLANRAMEKEAKTVRSVRGLRQSYVEA